MTLTRGSSLLGTTRRRLFLVFALALLVAAAGTGRASAEDGDPDEAASQSEEDLIGFRGRRRSQRATGGQHPGADRPRTR